MSIINTKTIELAGLQHNICVCSRNNTTRHTASNIYKNRPVFAPAQVAIEGMDKHPSCNFFLCQRRLNTPRYQTLFNPLSQLIYSEKMGGIGREGSYCLAFLYF